MALQESSPNSIFRPMKTSHLIFVVTYFAAASFNIAHARMDKLVKTLPGINLNAVLWGDLSNRSVVKAPLLENKSINLWRLNCMGCIEKLRKDWKDKNQIWINLDYDPDTFTKAILFLKHEKIEIVPYYDFTGSFKKQLGDFYLPVRFTVKNGKAKMLE